MESQQRCIRTLTHQATSLTFSSDGKSLVSFSNNNKTANVWDVNTGELKKTFTGLTSLTLSLDGKTLADSNKDNTIKLWDVETGELKNSLTGHPSKILFIAFSPDGKTLFISSNKKYTFYIHSPGGVDDYERTSNYTQLWDLTTGQIRKTFCNNRFCALSPDGGIFVGAQAESNSQGHKSINIIDVGTGQKIKSFPGTDAALSPNGKILAVSEEGQALKLLNWSSGISIATLPGRIRIFTFSPDGNILAVVDGGTIKLWQESTEPIMKQQLHGGAYPHLKRLENLLAAELWEDADQETANVIKRFLSQDLNVVDQLWIHYSNGRYGFSVQKQIWEGVLRNEGRRMRMNAGLLSDLNQFKYCVGWGTIDSYPYYHGDNDEYFKSAWQRTEKGYYPREVHQHQPLEIFSRIGG